MRSLLIGGALVTALLALASCDNARKGGELRLKHEVTIATSAGEQTFASVLSLEGIQTYNYGFGSHGWGGISGRLTGDALRVPVGENDFYFLLAKPGTATAPWTQMRLVKDYFGLSNAGDDGSWVHRWKGLAQSNASVDLSPEDWPAIAVMPRDGWMNDARVISAEEAAAMGLRIVRYRLRMTREPVGGTVPVEVRYRKAEGRPSRIEVGREFFTVENGTA